MTSPYWGKREYGNGGIGLEKDFREYREFIQAIAAAFAEIKRVLKPRGSFWLNIALTNQAHPPAHA